MKSVRLDVYLHSGGYCESREIAKKLVMAGKVLVNERVALKSSLLIKEDDVLRIKEKLPFVSRGGHKLDKAIKTFQIDVDGLNVLDVGASTGGFTDCLLQNGAAHVNAVDVGYGQFNWKLRNDERVSVFERTNARYLTPEIIGGVCNGAVCDASFISLMKLLPAIDVCTDNKAFFLGLIKPQFEAGRENVGKGGIVRDEKVHTKVIEKVLCFINEETNFNVVNLDFSPITGPKGNIEFLIYCIKDIDAKNINIREIVLKAHKLLCKS